MTFQEALKKSNALWVRALRLNEASDKRKRESVSWYTQALDLIHVEILALHGNLPDKIVPLTDGHNSLLLGFEVVFTSKKDGQVHKQSYLLEESHDQETKRTKEKVPYLSTP